MKNLTLHTTKYIHLQQGFREYLDILGYASTSVYTIPNTLREFLHWLENQGITTINDITPELVSSYFHALKQRENLKREGGLSNSYICKHLQAINLFNTYLNQSQQGSFHVEESYPKQERNIPDILMPEEVKLLFDTTEENKIGLRDKAMLSLYYGCGIRRNEGVHIDTSDVLFDRGMLYVRKGKNSTERYIPIKPQLLRYIADYMNYSRPELQREEQPTTALLIGQFGKRAGGQGLLLRLKRLKKNTQNQPLMDKQIGLHTLRHSVATHLLMKGMKLKRIAQFLGHKSIESTQIYTHIVAELTKNK